MEPKRMSSVVRRISAGKARSRPPLQNGDRLTQAEFHRPYKAHPDDVKFELIGGVVYMASPQREAHSEHLVICVEE
jgi:hypothetical protein